MANLPSPLKKLELPFTVRHDMATMKGFNRQTAALGEVAANATLGKSVVPGHDTYPNLPIDQSNTTPNTPEQN